MQRVAAWDSPVLQSVCAVIDDTNHVTTVPEAIERVAAWMAYEPFTPPAGGPAGPFDWGSDPDGVIDAVMVKATLDFAFTDFATGERFETTHQGRQWSDSEAMFACLHRAWSSGVPILDGEYLATVTADDLERIFEGPVPMPMIDERAAILNEVGTVLDDRYRGRFHGFVRDCAPAMVAAGSGLLERLVDEFPRFDDTSPYKSHEVTIHKLAQLSLWSLHLAVGRAGGITIRDLNAMSAFADYVVPVGLRLMGILDYSPALEERINAGELIGRDSEEEIEIRVHSLYATALLTDAINRRRPEGLGIIIPQVDYRLWSVYHTTHWPHHLTRTVMY